MKTKMTMNKVQETFIAIQTQIAWYVTLVALVLIVMVGFNWYYQTKIAYRVIGLCESRGGVVHQRNAFDEVVCELPKKQAEEEIKVVGTCPNTNICAIAEGVVLPTITVNTEGHLK